MGCDWSGSLPSDQNTWRHWCTALLSTIHALFSRSQIVHYHALGPALFSFLPRLVGKKTVVTVQGLDWQRKKWGWAASTVLRLGEQAAVRLPSSTVVVSHTLQEYYRRQILEWGLEPGNYILFPGSRRKRIAIC